jgi:hypothetical protein
VDNARRSDGGQHKERREVEELTQPRKTGREEGSRGPNVVAADMTINKGKVSDGSKDGVQRWQRATSLRRRMRRKMEGWEEHDG